MKIVIGKKDMCQEVDFPETFLDEARLAFMKHCHKRDIRNGLNGAEYWQICKSIPSAKETWEMVESLPSFKELLERRLSKCKSQDEKDQLRYNYSGDHLMHGVILPSLRRDDKFRKSIYKLMAPRDAIYRTIYTKEGKQQFTRSQWLDHDRKWVYHNLSGPALIKDDGKEEYYIDGSFIGKREHELIRSLVEKIPVELRLTDETWWIRESVKKD